MIVLEEGFIKTVHNMADLWLARYTGDTNEVWDEDELLEDASKLLEQLVQMARDIYPDPLVPTWQEENPDLVPVEDNEVAEVDQAQVILTWLEG